MSANLTTTSVVPPAVRDYYERVLLMTAYPELIYAKFGQKKNLPRKSGDTAVFRRINRLSTVPIPLVDGITPPGTPLSVTDIKAQVSWYGNFVTITDQVQYTVESDVLNDAARLLAQNLAQTLDQVTRDVLWSGASTLSCSNGSNGQTPTEITYGDVTAAVKVLYNGDALMMTAPIEGDLKFGTAPVQKSYWVLSDSGIMDDLQAIAGFLPVANYPRAEALDAEWGTVDRARFLISSVGTVSSAAVPVYANIFLGKEAYGIVSLGSEAGEFYIDPLGSAGAADPLRQRATIGWKLPFVARIFNDAFLLNLQCTHS